MFGFLVTLLILDGLLLATVVLLQAGQGGGLASLGGGGTTQVLGGRQATTILTKATWVSGGVFLFLALLLSFVSPSGAGLTGVQRQLQQQPAPAAQIPVAPIQGTTPPPAPAPGAAPPATTPAPAGGKQP